MTPIWLEHWAAASRLPPPSHTGADARRALRQVLDRPEFREPPAPVLTRLRDALFELVGRLLSRILEGAPGTLAGWLVVVAVVAGLVALGVWFARSVRRDPAARAAAADRPRRTAADWRARAARHEAAGEWREALRCRYRALVADLAARGLVEEVPGRTAGEYRAEVARNVPAAATPFARATDLFERAWYGHAPAGPDDADRFGALARDVLAGAGT